MSWPMVVSGLLLWVGVTLLLSQLRWFSRRSLADRVALYAPGGMARRERSGLLSVESFNEVVGPLASAIGGRVSALFGVSEDLERRLERIHSPMGVTAFRVRQSAWALVAFGVAAAGAVALRPPLLVGLAMIAGLPLLAFLLLEQHVVAASERWKRRIFLELPVVSEQLAMLVSAGFSLSAALGRIAGRGHGAIQHDLARVNTRIRQGLSDVEALEEWAALADVPALTRLVPVLALNRQATDLGRLITEEARAIRRDVQRELIETVEQRAQKVWVPVTIATLIPGVIFLAVPFAVAMSRFAG
ncbi:MAG TPA: type II secretion system F family protein [Egibacteraceae bacterium]|jgi:tight adherence protein C|nr:type II secretion system F family protein [Egibacteraceae bacterium]